MLRIRTLTVTQGIQWLSCGLRFWSKRPIEGTVPVAVFMLVAGLLRLLPVFGDVLLLLMLPTVAASYLIHVHALSIVNAARRNSAGAARARFERQLKTIRTGCSAPGPSRRIFFPWP